MADLSLSPITLREKIGQLLVLGFDEGVVTEQSSIVESIVQDNLGGVVLFDYDFKQGEFDKNISSPNQVKALNEQLQGFALKGQQSNQRPLLPLFIGVDYEGGRVNRLHPRYGFPEIPSPKEQGALENSAVLEVATQMSQTLACARFNVNFAPSLDVNVDCNSPAIGRLGRSFSDQSSVVSHLGQLISKQFIHHRIVPCFKHFPGHGSAASDTHHGFVDITSTWSEDELVPYQERNVGDDGQVMIMTAHVINQALDDTGVPATLSKNVITTLLREKLAYSGVVITDDMQMKAISEHYGLEQSIKMSLNAGVDMLLFGNQLVEEPVSAARLITLIEQMVINGGISKARIEQAYQRVVRLKQNVILNEA